MRAAVFDIDGTLLDSSPMWAGLGGRYLARHGFPAGNIAQRLAELSLEEGARLLSDEYTRDGAQVVLAELRGIMERFYREEARLKRGAAELVDGLCARGWALSLATAGDAELSRCALTRLGLWERFRGLADCARYGAKTSAGVFLAAAELCGARPCECVVFEDSLHAVVTAKKAGFVTAAVRDESEPQQALLAQTADYYRPDLTGYLELFCNNKGG